MTRLRTILVLLAIVAAAQPARADWLLTPFAGASARTQTALFDLDDAAKRTHATYGAALTLRPDGVLGADVEVSWTPSILTGHDLVESSRATTAIASVVVMLPKRWSRIVRPYASLGFGVVAVHSVDVAAIFPVDETSTAGSIAAGAWVPIGKRFGARASVRYLRTGSDGARTTFETWQSTVGVTIAF